MRNGFPGLVLSFFCAAGALIFVAGAVPAAPCHQTTELYALARSNSKKSTVFVRQGSRTLARVADFTRRYPVTAMAFANLDADPQLELVVGRGGAACQTCKKAPRLIVYDDREHQFRRLSSSLRWAPSHGVTRISVADINGDGRDEVVVGMNQASESSASKLLMLSDFDSSPNAGFRRTEFFEAWGEGSSVSGMAFGDWNGDGVPELALTRDCQTGCGGRARLKVLAFDAGSRTWSTRFRAGTDVYAGNQSLKGVAWVDFDGNKLTDLVTIASGRRGQARVALFMSEIADAGSLRFARPLDPSTANWDARRVPRAVAVGQLGPGKKSKVVVALGCPGCRGVPQFIAFGANNAGLFTELLGRRGRVDAEPQAVGVFDIDGDSHPEIVLGNSVMDVGSLVVNDDVAHAFSPLKGYRPGWQVGSQVDVITKGEGVCLRQGEGHRLPASVAAADARLPQRVGRLLQAELSISQTRKGTSKSRSGFGPWSNTNSQPLRYALAGLMALESRQRFRPQDDLPGRFETYLYNHARQHAALGTSRGEGASGDFDFHLTSALTLLYHFKSAPQLLTDAAAHSLLFYAKRSRRDCVGRRERGCRARVPSVGSEAVGLSLRYDVPVLGGITLPETENHALMINTWAYLANQWITNNPRGDRAISSMVGRSKGKYTNAGSGLEKMLLTMLARFLHNGAFETNARPYQAYTLRCLMLLASYAEGSAVRTGARNAVDYLAARIATQSLAGKRYAPMRRQWAKRRELGLYVSDYAPIMFGILTGAYSFNDDPTCRAQNCLWASGGQQYRGFALEAASMPYRVPAQLHDLMLHPDNARPGFGLYTRAAARYSEHFMRSHGKPRYPVPNIMAQPDLDRIAESPMLAAQVGEITCLAEASQRRKALAGLALCHTDAGCARLERGLGANCDRGGFRFEAAYEHYFLGKDYLLSSGGQSTLFRHANLNLLERSLQPAHARRARSFVARPSSLILAGDHGSWRTLAEGQGVMPLVAGSGWRSKNGPVYKNVLLGYTRGELFAFPTPHDWRETPAVQMPGGRHVKVVTPPGSSVHVIVVSFNGGRAGLVEVVPASPSLSAAAVLQRAQASNSALPALHYQTQLSYERLVIAASPTDLPRLIKIDGRAAGEVEPRTYSERVKYPLLLAQQIDAEGHFTGLDYVRAVGDGRVMIRNPRLNSSLLLDSSDPQKPRRKTGF